MSRLMNTLHQYKPQRLKKANKREKKNTKSTVVGASLFFKRKNYNCYYIMDIYL